MRKFVTLLLSLCLLCACLPAAAGAETTETTATPVVNDTGSPVTLTVFRYIDTNLQDYIQDWNETPFYQKMEELTGVHVDFVSPPYSTAQETLNSLLISGDMPDIIIGSNLYSSGTYQAYVDGYYVDLAPYLEKSAPDYWSIITGSDSIWRETVDDNGVISSMYRVYRETNPAWMRLVLKKEMMDQLGVPEVPKTVDQWSALFQKMLEAGVTPFVLNSTGYDEKFMGAYDVRQDFYQDNGTVKFGQTEEGFRKYLELMHDWYEKGYISKDFASISNVDTLFSMGKVGTYDKPIVAAYNFGVSEGYTVLSTPYPRLTEDQFLHWDSYKASNVGKNMEYGNVAVTTSCKNIEMAVKWLNFLYTDAGSNLANWGIEGLNYETVDGKKQYLPAMWDYKGISQEGLNYYFKGHNCATYAYSDTTCHANLLKSPEATAIRLEYDDDPLLDSALYLPSISLTEEESETRTDVMTDIDTYVDEMVLKFIIGTESLDGWDAYVATVKSMNLQDAINVTQAAYDRYMSVTVR